MLKRFASIQYPEKYGYAYDSEAYTQHANTASTFRFFETYGDGMVQHSGDRSVTPELLADYLASLTAAMLEDDEFSSKIEYTLLRAPSVDRIVFAAGLVATPADLEYYGKKRRFYSITEMKAAAKPELQHDKRYEPFAEWMDGSGPAILRLITPSYAEPWERYCYAETVRTWCINQPQTKKGKSAVWLDMPALHLEWMKDHDAARRLHSAYNLVTTAARAGNLMRAAHGDLENWRSNTERERQRQEEPADTAVA